MFTFSLPCYHNPLWNLIRYCFKTARQWKLIQFLFIVFLLSIIRRTTHFFDPFLQFTFRFQFLSVRWSQTNLIEFNEKKLEYEHKHACTFIMYNELFKMMLFIVFSLWYIHNLYVDLCYEPRRAQNERAKCGKMINFIIYFFLLGIF